MITDAMTFVFSAAVKVTLASLFLWGGAYVAGVRKKEWIRAWLCAGLLYVVSLALCNSLTLIPVVGATVGAVATALLWFPVVAGAFDTTNLKAAAVLAVGLLVYPGWTFGAL